MRKGMKTRETTSRILKSENLCIESQYLCHQIKKLKMFTQKELQSQGKDYWRILCLHHLRGYCSPHHPKMLPLHECFCLYLPWENDHLCSNPTNVVKCNLESYRKKVSKQCYSSLSLDTQKTM